jgi:hypothetical protein
MTIHQFHSFVKLVRKMHGCQQDFFLRGRIGAENAMSQAKVLEKKVDQQIRLFNPQTPTFYEWQPNFLALIKALRMEQTLYFQTRYDSVKMRCKKMESELDKSFVFLEQNFPNVFIHIETAKQQSLDF